MSNEKKDKIYTLEMLSQRLGLSEKEILEEKLIEYKKLQFKNYKEIPLSQKIYVWLGSDQVNTWIANKDVPQSIRQNIINDGDIIIQEKTPKIAEIDLELLEKQIIDMNESKASFKIKELNKKENNLVEITTRTEKFSAAVHYELLRTKEITSHHIFFYAGSELSWERKNNKIIKNEDILPVSFEIYERNDKSLPSNNSKKNKLNKKVLSDKSLVSKISKLSYMDQDHPNHSTELRLAVEAWQYLYENQDAGVSLIRGFDQWAEKKKHEFKTTASKARVFKVSNPDPGKGKKGSPLSIDKNKKKK